MNSVYSLQQLIIELSNAPKEAFHKILKRFDIDRNSLSKFENWSEDTYVRNGIYKNDRFEVILLCWEQGQETAVHCHGGEECWLYVLEGELEEVYFKKLNTKTIVELHSHTLKASKSSYINDLLGLHKLKNTSNGRTLSLHVYAKPIVTCSVYDSEEKTFKRKILSYDTFDGVSYTDLMVEIN